ncbi:MAG: hypothetical protein KF875_03525 [Trueperaceae bacterium]|nr:hypothetical protein [Trueperaceae bacterium]
MILPAILALVALSVADPSGDAFGDGTLTPPTAPVYADTAVFDIRAVDLTAVSGGTRLSVALGSLGSAGGGAGAGAARSEDAPAPVDEEGDPAPPDGGQQDELVAEVPLTGFLPAVVDVYLVGAGPGFTATLPGPDLDFPTGTAWQYAVRISSDGAYLVAYPGTPVAPEASGGTAPGDDPTAVDTGEDAATGGGDETGQGVAEPGPGDMPRLALAVNRRGRDLVVYLPVTVADDTRVQAMSGVYDPFSSTGWRGLSPTPSPWAFSGANAQVSPVIDLLSADPEAQASAIATGVLPRQSEARAIKFTPWPYVMVIGLLLALGGLVSRSRVKVGEKDAVGAAAVTADAATAAGVATAGAATDAGALTDADALVDADALTDADAAMPAAAATAVVMYPAVTDPTVTDEGAAAPTASEAGGTDASVPVEAAPADVMASDAAESGSPEGEPDPAFGGEWEEPSDVDPLAGFAAAPRAAAGEDGAPDHGLDDPRDGDDDDDDDLYDPVATAADVLAAEVAAADEAGAADQELLVDDTDELVLDTGEREAAFIGLFGQEGDPATAPAAEPGEQLPGPAPEQHATGPEPEPEPTEAQAAESAKDPFGTEAGNTFLLPIDDPSAVEDFIDELGGEESFWHPSTRSAYRPPTLETAPELAEVAEGAEDAEATRAAAASPGDAPAPGPGTGGSEPDEDADPA